MLNHVWLFATPWTEARQAPLSSEFSRQEYRSGLPFPSPGDLLDAGVKPPSPALVGRFLTLSPPEKPLSGSDSSLTPSSLCRRPPTPI